MEKKNIAIIVLVVALIASGIGNIVLLLPQAVPPPEYGTTFIRATISGPDTLELVDSWDSASNDVLEQVVENLFDYDLFNYDLPRINQLAYSYYWTDTTHLQIALRQGILFHDGTPFNAAAAKWNLDRLLYLTNCTGTNHVQTAQTQSLWMFPDGVTPIIHDVAAPTEYNITITLNGAYAPFLDTLCYINAGMISPDSASQTEFIDLTTGDLIGTGPFTYSNYVPDVEVVFGRWDAYWQGPANFQTMKYSIYTDTTVAHNAFLAYAIDYNAAITVANLPLYDLDPKMKVKRFTEDTGRTGLSYYYIGFNNRVYNKTWRQAMSYAFNYIYCLTEIMSAGGISIGIKADSPISPGWGGVYNASVTGPDFDIPKARGIVQSMGYGAGWDTTFPGTDEALWTGATFFTINFTYNIGNTVREDMAYAVGDWFDLIGIGATPVGLTWSAYLDLLYNQPERLGLYNIGWAPDYLEPYNMLDPLFNPASSSNSAGVDDEWLNDKMAEALVTVDDTARQNIYKLIQWYISNELCPHIFLYHPRVVSVHLSNIYNVPYNAMGSWDAYPIYR